MLDARIQSFELAYRMQTEAAAAFDISDEPQHILDLYGPGVQGRQMLLARRLVERGVRFVQLWHGAGQPWDSHDDIQDHKTLATECDQAIAALLTDLKQRGLFDETLVIWGGEFGRTPTVELPTVVVNTGLTKGRDHNHYGFSMWLAGGGVKGGYVHGATDEFGFKAVENKVHVHDLHATILHLLGFDHEKFTYRYAGRDFRLTDVSGPRGARDFGVTTRDVCRHGYFQPLGRRRHRRLPQANAAVVHGHALVHQQPDAGQLIGRVENGGQQQLVLKDSARQSRRDDLCWPAKLADLLDNRRGQRGMESGRDFRPGLGPNAGRERSPTASADDRGRETDMAAAARIAGPDAPARWPPALRTSARA